MSGRAVKSSMVSLIRSSKSRAWLACEQLLVAAVDAGGYLFVEVLGLADGLLGRCEDGLGRAYLREESPGRVALVAQADVFHGLLDEADLVVVVVDGEVAPVAEDVGVLAQDAHAQGVEGADGELFGAGADEPFEALLHLGGGLVGEGDGADAAGPYVLYLHEVGDTVGEDAGLAAARARDDEERATGGDYGFALLRVQAFEDCGVRSAECGMGA